MREIKVYGDYGYVSECLLYEDTGIKSAIRWVEDYISDNTFGGYNIIEVAEFADDGEYIVHRCWNQSEFIEEDGFLFDEF